MWRLPLEYKKYFLFYQRPSEILKRVPVGQMKRQYGRGTMIESAIITAVTIIMVIGADSKRKA